MVSVCVCGCGMCALYKSSVRYEMKAMEIYREYIHRPIGLLSITRHTAIPLPPSAAPLLCRSPKDAHYPKEAYYPYGQPM